MPEEKDKVENLVDVGEADQQATEVNLDDKGEPEKDVEETEVEVEVSGFKVDPNVGILVGIGALAFIAYVAEKKK